MKKLILLLSLGLFLTGCDWFSGDDDDDKEGGISKTDTSVEVKDSQYQFKNDTPVEIKVTITGETAPIVTLATETCKIVTISADQKTKIDGEATFEVAVGEAGKTCGNCSSINTSNSSFTFDGSSADDVLVKQASPKGFDKACQ